MKIDKKVIISALTLTLLAENGYCAVKQVKKTTQKTKPVKQKVITAKVAQNYSQIDQMIDYGEFSKADKMLSDIIKKNPFDMEARSLQVVSEAKQGKLDTAQEKLNSYLPKMSNNANLHYAQGIINLKRQASSDLDYRNNSEELIKNAVKEFQTAVKLNPKHYPAYNALGVTALNIGNFSKAKEFFSEALEINPNYATAIDNLGTLDYLEENYDAATKKFLKAISLNPNNSTAYFHLAQVYDKKSMYSKGLDAVDHSLRINNNSSVSYNLRGEMLRKQGNETAAIESFKKSMAIKPENIKPYINLSKIYERRFDNEIAIAYLKSALAINPSMNEVKLKLGDICFLNRDYDGALKYYGSLLGVENYNNLALKGMANAYFEQSKEIASKSNTLRDKDLQDAYKNVEKALKLNPNDLDLYLTKLKLAKLTNQEAVAQQTAHKIISMPVKGINDMLAKGDAYFAMNRFKEAKNAFEQSVLYAQSVDDCLYVAEILTYDKFYPSAKTILRKVLEQDPQNEEALHNLNYIMSMEKQSESLYNDAQFLKKKEKNKVFAREYALKASEMNPTNYKSALLSAKLCEQQKHYKEAIAEYKKLAGLEVKPRKINKYKKKAMKLEKKLQKADKTYMKNEKREFKKWQNKLTPNL